MADKKVIIPPEFRNSAINIIGDATVGDHSFMFVVTCPCGQSFLMAGIVGLPRRCSNEQCRRVYRLNSWPVASPDGKLQYKLGWMNTEGVPGA